MDSQAPTLRWGSVSGLSKKARLIVGNRFTDWWITGYNRPPKWVACHEWHELAIFDTRQEAEAFAETTYLLQEAAQ